MPFTKANWPRLLRDPTHAESLRYESGSITITLGGAVSAAMAGLKYLLDAEGRIVEDPEMRGGIPTIRGTRIGVYEAAGALKAGGMDEALEIFPTLNRDDLEAAALYAKAHPSPGRPRRRGPPYPGLRLVSVKRSPRPVVS